MQGGLAEVGAHMTWDGEWGLQKGYDAAQG